MGVRYLLSSGADYLAFANDDELFAFFQKLDERIEASLKAIPDQRIASAINEG